MKYSGLIHRNKAFIILVFVGISLFTNCKLFKKNNKQTNGIITVKQLYAHSCGTCHRLYKADEYNADNWKNILDSMQKRAHLTDKDIDDIYLYLTK